MCFQLGHVFQQTLHITVPFWGQQKTQSTYGEHKNLLKFFFQVYPIRDWSFSNDDGDGNENVKKRNCSYLSKTTTFYAHHTFLYISLSSLQDYDVKVLSLNLLIFVSFPKLGCVPQEINSWKILLHLTFSANWNKCKKF